MSEKADTRVSLSKSALLLSGCLAWAHPQARWYDEEFTDKSKRDRGIEVHREIAEYISCSEVIVNDELSKIAIDWFYTDLLLRCSEVFTELPISINWEEQKSEILVGVTDRQYPSRPGWKNGTADLVCILKTGELLIADWKTGGATGATEQLLSLASGFQWLPEYKGMPVRIAILSIDENGVWPDERPVSNEELDNHRTAMRWAYSDSEKPSEAKPGIHCSQLYCPHLAYCDAVKDITQELGMADEVKQEKPLLPPERLMRRFELVDDPKDQEEAGAVMARITAANRQSKYITEKMKDFVKKGGRVTSGQYEWKERGSNGFRWGRI